MNSESLSSPAARAAKKLVLSLSLPSESLDCSSSEIGVCSCTSYENRRKKRTERPREYKTRESLAGRKGDEP